MTTPPLDWTAAPLRAEVEAFLYHEARLLDERRWEDWQNLFTEEGAYWMPVAQDQENPLDHVSLIYETREKMTLRIKRFSHPDIISQQPASRTAHMVSNVMVDAVMDDGNALSVHALFHVTESRGEDTRRFAGHYEIDLVRAPGPVPFRIARKKVVLLDSDAPLTNIYIYL